MAQISGSMKKKPLIIKKGSAIAKIFHTPTGKYDGWTVEYYAAGQRHRIKRATLEGPKGARAIAKSKLEAINTGNIAQLHMTSSDMELLARCKQIIQCTGRSLETVCLEHVEMWRIAKDMPMLDAIKYAVSKQPRRRAAKLISDAIAEYLTTKAQDDVSPHHLTDLTTRLNRFGRDISGDISSLTGTDLDKWLRALPDIGPRSRNNYRSCLSSFFSFCKQRDYLAKDWAELDVVQVARARIGKIHIWTPDELSRLLTGANDASVELYLLLGAFAGIRTQEIFRLKFENILWDSKYISVNAEMSKVNDRRLVPIQPNLLEWLLRYRTSKGPIISEYPDTNFLTRAAKRAAALLGIDWKHNALRHSYASYRLAATQDAPRVAEEMGKMRRKNGNWV